MPLLKFLVQKAVEKYIPIDLLARGLFQPRQEFNEPKLQELADSIKSAGVLTALIVRSKPPGKFEIIAGERRWRAAQRAELQEVPCKIIECDDEQALQIALIENLAREDLNPIEEARGIQRLMDEFQYTQAEVAESLGAERPTISNLLRLLDLHKDVQTLILKGQLTESHGKILLSLPIEQHYVYAKETIAKAWSTRQLDSVIKNDQRKKTLATATKSTNADIQRLERNLSTYLCAAVKIQSLGKTKGLVKIAYNNFDELEGILEKIGYRDEE